MFEIINISEFDIIRLKTNKWINYTKLCKNLNNNFKTIINENINMSKLIKTHENINYEITLKNLIKNNILIKYSNVEDKFKGVYGPEYMLEFIIFTCDITYHKIILDSLKFKYEDKIENKSIDVFDSQIEDIFNTQFSFFEDKLDNYFDSLDKSYSSLIDKMNKLITNFNEYTIILYKDDTEDNLIRLFMGTENKIPKIENEKILLQLSTDSSLEMVKTFLYNISYKNILNITSHVDIIEFNTILTAKITVANYYINIFIDKFKSKFINIMNDTSDDICDFYNLSLDKYEKILNDGYRYKYKNRWREVKIDEFENKLYVNYGKNNSGKYYLKYDEI